jgi:hypothetical protein
MFCGRHDSRTAGYKNDIRTLFLDGEHLPMHALIRQAKLLLVFPALMIMVGLASPTFAQEPPTYDDPFYSQKGALDIIEEDRLAPFEQVKESADPFTGNMNLLHTDVILPGNGGLGRQAQVLL